MTAVAYTHAHTDILLAVAGIALAAWLIYELIRDPR